MRRKQKSKGFTLIELLVVIAIIALLLSILIPALNYVKVQATGIVCLSNLNGVGKCWVLYAVDNDSEVIGSDTGGLDGYRNQGYPGPNPVTSRQVWSFVATPQNQSSAFSNDSIMDEVRGIEKGGLWSYIENYKIYHCPTDKRHLKPPTTTTNGTKGGYRSYSIVGVYNGGITGGSWDTKEPLAMVYKTGEIVTPGHKIVWLEEADGHGWNHRTWNIFLDTTSKWGDPFAIWHNNRSTLGFADGHAEMHYWEDDSTRAMSEAQTKQYAIPSDEGKDIGWFLRHYIPGRIPSAVRAIMPPLK